MNISLHQKLTDYTIFLGGRNYYKENVPNYVKENLNSKFELRPYQLEALGRFRFYFENYSQNHEAERPLRLLFHMATGSGKTLIMAGLMLDLYKKGYRNFLFFVNRENIIRKTQEVFFNQNCSKYLFNETIQFDGQIMELVQVDTLQVTNDDAINVAFCTVQELHSRLNSPQENCVTFDDFIDKKVVLISDEAHHINVHTRRSSQTARFTEHSNWEQTVDRIFGANSDNILLEFTATMDLENHAIRRKYIDQVIFEYTLKEFREQLYSKEVKVLQSEVDQYDRSLQAMLISQVRRKIFNKHGILIKPVILFKSKTIKDSKSFQELFVEKTKALTGKHLFTILDQPDKDNVLEDVDVFLNENNIDLDNLAMELREEFSENKCVSIDSKNESETQQIAVNSLEDLDNEYRAVFAVDKLNEGWDVLNLFDIVRLYDTRDSKSGSPGKTTISEAQLIGRGARYCPFQVHDSQPKDQRKYDSVGFEHGNEHELKLCEELYYHSASNPKYIQELKSALRDSGILPFEYVERKIKLKQNFKRSRFYKTGSVYVNRKQKYDRKDITSIGREFIDDDHHFKLRSRESRSFGLFDDGAATTTELSSERYAISTFGTSVIRKAMHKFIELRFCNLKQWFPNLKGSLEFITSDKYLGDIEVTVEVPKQRSGGNLSQDDKLFVITSLLEKLIQTLRDQQVDYKGTLEFEPQRIKNVFYNKSINFSRETAHQERGLPQSQSKKLELQIDLSKQNWFVFDEFYGTSEEKLFIKYLSRAVAELEEKYGEVYLIRNEKHLKIYNFDDGRAFEPDFVLFLLNVKDESGMQVFIEPKGKHLLEEDGWKQQLLLELKRKHKITELLDHENYKVWGLPFYNSENTSIFNKAFRKDLLNRDDP